MTGLSPSRAVHVVTGTFTADTNIYADGDLITDKLELTGIGDGVRRRGGVIQDVLITDLAKQAANIDLLLFDEDPSGTTFTKNAAFDIADADLAKLIACIELTDHASFSGNSVTFAHNLAIPFVLPAEATSIYACLVSRGTPTYGESDLAIRLGILLD